MIRAVLFDLDNTLVDRDGAFRECVEAIFPDPATRRELSRLDHGGRGTRSELFQCWSHHAGAPIDQAAFGRLIAGHLQPDPGLLVALRALAKTMKLGVISNGNGEIQRLKLRAAGLDEIFDPDRVWISGEIGSAKPDPAIFLLAVQSLGETPGRCLYVGDNEQDDFFGATNAGLHGCLVKTVLNAERLECLLEQERLR
jgi:HAD superfamily hydrolase (TIGR01509 family)